MVVKDDSEEMNGWNYMASRLFLECGHKVVLLEQSKNKVVLLESRLSAWIQATSSWMVRG